MHKHLCFCFIAVIVFVCSCETKEQPWNPIIEETGFNYLETAIDQALTEMDLLENRLKNGDTSDSYTAIRNAKQIMLGLKEYYVPLTIVRQLIYDAERFFYMKNTVEAEKRLKMARNIIEKMIALFNSEDFGKVFEELIVMVDTCTMSMNDPSNREFKSLENLGNKVNLMLIKGELELSGKTLN